MQSVGHGRSLQRSEEVISLNGYVFEQRWEKLGAVRGIQLEAGESDIKSDLQIKAEALEAENLALRAKLERSAQIIRELQADLSRALGKVE